MVHVDPGTVSILVVDPDHTTVTITGSGAAWADNTDATHTSETDPGGGALSVPYAPMVSWPTGLTVTGIVLHIRARAEGGAELFPSLTGTLDVYPPSTTPTERATNKALWTGLGAVELTQVFDWYAADLVPFSGTYTIQQAAAVADRYLYVSSVDDSGWETIVSEAWVEIVATATNYPLRRYPPINNGGSGPTRHYPRAVNRRAGGTY